MSCDEIAISIQDQRRNNGDGVVPMYEATGLALVGQSLHTVSGFEFKRASADRAIFHVLNLTPNALMRSDENTLILLKCDIRRNQRWLIRLPIPDTAVSTLMGHTDTVC